MLLHTVLWLCTQRSNRQNHQSNLQVCVQGAREGPGSRPQAAVRSSRHPSLTHKGRRLAQLCIHLKGHLYAISKNPAEASSNCKPKVFCKPEKIILKPVFHRDSNHHSDDHPILSCRVVFRPALKSPGMQCLSPISDLLETKSAFLTNSPDDSHPHSVWERVFQAMDPTRPEQSQEQAHNLN